MSQSGHLVTISMKLLIQISQIAKTLGAKLGMHNDLDITYSLIGKSDYVDRDGWTHDRLI